MAIKLNDVIAAKSQTITFFNRFVVSVSYFNAVLLRFTKYGKIYETLYTRVVCFCPCFRLCLFAHDNLFLHIRQGLPRFSQMLTNLILRTLIRPVGWI